MKLKDLGEFELINRFARLFSSNMPKGVEGIGNDCAVIPFGKDNALLVTTDLLVENTHFIKHLISPRDLGYKSLSVNISDIAAMGGKPKYAFLSLALPSETSLAWIDAFMLAFAQLAEETDVLLLGGDTTRSTLITVNVLIIGEIVPTTIKRRSQAVVGDIICCTGFLGDSGGGLKIVLEDLPQNEVEKELIEAHYRPYPHLKEGNWLAQQAGVHAMMDISDGLASDIRRVMEESLCGAHIEVEKLPLSDNLVKASTRHHWKAEELALTAGEDYCLLLTVDPSKYRELSDHFSHQFQRPLYQIGTILPGSELKYTFHKEPYLPSGSGFDHFKSGS